MKLAVELRKPILSPGRKTRTYPSSAARAFPDAVGGRCCLMTVFDRALFRRRYLSSDRSFIQGAGERVHFEIETRPGKMSFRELREFPRVGAVAERIMSLKCH